MTDDIVVEEQIYATGEKIKYRESSNDYTITFTIDPEKFPEAWKPKVCNNSLCDKVANEFVKDAPCILSIGKKDEQE